MIWCVLMVALVAGSCSLAAESRVANWVGTWGTAPLATSSTKDQTPLAGATLRQVVRVSLGGNQFRVRFSNAFGTEALSFHGAHVALAAAAGAIEPGTDRVLGFAGRTAVTIPPGATYLSDPVDLALAPQADVAISIHFQQVPATLTMHGGSRTTSYLQAGDALAAPALPDAAKIVHWYFISGLDVLPAAPAAAVVVLGDSITDGYGSTTDRNNRWTDVLAGRLQAPAGTAPVGLLNQGIGGNRLLRDGLGPNILARLDRDVITQTGARWLVVQAGINDLGTRLDARKKGEPFASADEIIGAYEQIIARARSAGLKVFGATLTPYGGSASYWSEDGEADRQAINRWIRESGRFDAVIDFDLALRDPQQPGRLAKPYDNGDHLHPSLAGYKRMGEFVDLNLFKP